MKLWAKLTTDGKILKDIIYKDDFSVSENNFLNALRQLSYELDIATPMCLKVHLRHFKNFGIVKFSPNDFVEDFPYDYLEIEGVKQ